MRYTEDKPLKRISGKRGRNYTQATHVMGTLEKQAASQQSTVQTVQRLTPLPW